ncbi:MAG: type II secretion system protein [Candidatus Shapirobacteria bacterium]|jgi:Tfp pilus assembly protein PilV
MQTEKGQSLIEVVFSVAIVVLVITGVVALIISTVSIKTNAFQRKTASSLAEAVIENLISTQKSDPENFWLLENIAAGQTLPTFSGYTYAVNYVQKTNGGCSAVRKECADTSVIVSWGDKSMTVNRFFSRNN